MLEIPGDAVSAWDKFKEQLKERDREFMEEYRDITKDALVAQRSEQDAHNVLVTGSNPVEGTTTSQRLRDIAHSLLEMADKYEGEQNEQSN